MEPVFWRVLEVCGDKTALMLSEKILDGGVSFNPDYSDDDPYYCWWSESQIRKFLNGKEYVGSVSADVTKITVRNPKTYSFYEKAFSAGEGSGIIKAAVDNSVRYNYHTNFTAGPETADRIFLLSYADVDESNNAQALGKKYGFVDNGSRKAELTDYGASQGVNNYTKENKKYGYWWLRSPGGSVRKASDVDLDGNLDNDFVNYGAVGLRPAFRLNLENIIFTSPAAGGKQDDLTASLYKQSYASDDKGRDEHKLTLATNTYKLASADVTSGKITAASVDVAYSGASTGAGYHLASVVTSGDRSLYYGRIKSLETAADAAGAATFVIPEYREGEEVYIFVEGRNDNDDYKTDFASVPICIAGSGRVIKALPKDVEEPRPDTKSVTVNPSELTLIIGYDKQLTASFAPDGALEAVIWSSDKPDVAAVDPVTGVVSALKAGSAKVTAKAKTSCKEASCTVTVIEKPLNPALILTPAAMTVSKGVTEKITASFRGIAEQPLTWSSSKESVATVDKDGKVTAKGEGNCVITAVTEDGAYSESCEVKVTAATVVHGGGSSGCNGVGAGAFALLVILPCLLIRGKRER
ncbi:MAG: Ig-like domain-containing protein [Synergistaceae bacterium]|nr:Ig-like domain-containing protein [Synergistaceae bacterium]